MFETDQKAIGAWARQSPDNTARVLQFVILTIRCPLYQAAGALQELIQGSPEADRWLYGFKGRACAEVWRDRAATHGYLEHVWASTDSDQDKAIAIVEYVAALHGFGVVKAGFVAQLIYGLAGCIDAHNLTRFKIKRRAFRSDGLPPTRRKVIKYVKTCAKLGGSAYLWNSWCEYVANNQPKTYPSARAVSRLHAEAFNLAT